METDPNQGRIADKMETNVTEIYQDFKIRQNLCQWKQGKR